MNCPNCGAPLREGAAFCTSCGSPVSASAPERKPSRLKSTIPMDEAPVLQPRPTAEEQPPVVQQMPKTAPAPEPKTYAAPPAYAPAPAPKKKEKKKKSGGPSKVGAFLHRFRAYLAVLRAVCCVALLFLPCFRTAVCVEGETTLDGAQYDYVFGTDDVEDADEQEQVSILQIATMEELEDVVGLRLDNESFERALKEQDLKKSDYINKMLVGEKDGKPADVSTVKVLGMNLPTGVVALAPQLLCVLLMVIFFIIGVIRVFVSEPFPDGAPKTGWLKAGGIVGLVMSVFTAAEVFAIDHFFDQLVDKYRSEKFDADIELFLGLTKWFVLFAAAALIVVLLATHWGRKKQQDAAFADASEAF